MRECVGLRMRNHSAFQAESGEPVEILKAYVSRAKH